jgi:hypothetical protein
MRRLILLVPLSLGFVFSAIAQRGSDVPEDPNHFYRDDDSSLSGVIVDQAGTAIPFAEVTMCAGASIVAHTKSDSNGQYQIVAHCEAQCKIGVEKAGFAPLIAEFDAGSKVKITLTLKTTSTLHQTTGVEKTGSSRGSADIAETGKENVPPSSQTPAAPRQATPTEIEQFLQSGSGDEDTPPRAAPAPTSHRET